MGPEVIPAILAKDKEDLLRRVLSVKEFVRIIQIDVMDGIFVPNKTVGLDSLESLPKNLKYEFHWMVKDPINWVKRFPGPHIHLIHIETIHSKKEFDELEVLVKKLGGKLALAINPETPLESLTAYLNRVGEVLIMTVHPGFSGQSYIAEMASKIRKLRTLNPKLDIEVDGGVNLKTIAHAYAAGANLLVAASSIFSSSDKKAAIEELKRRATHGSVAGSEASTASEAGATGAAGARS